jgi:hypothetical protein
MFPKEPAIATVSFLSVPKTDRLFIGGVRVWLYAADSF